MGFSREYQMREVKTLTEQRDALLAALETAERRLRVYAEWASREIVASRGTWVIREIASGTLTDANDARAAIAKVEGEVRWPGYTPEAQAYETRTRAVAPGTPTTCLDCQVLPPFSIRLCAFHATTEELLAALADVMTWAEGENAEFNRARALLERLGR